MFPTEFFSNAVYKSPQASLPGGISGVVDMRVMRPFDIPGRHFNYSGRFDCTIGEEWNPRGSAM